MIGETKSKSPLPSPSSSLPTVGATVPPQPGEEEEEEKEEGRLPSGPAVDAQIPLPRVTIRFCTQCKWMLRAAYYAQELLSTFSTSLGEVALQPSTGGVFVIQIHHVPPTPAAAAAAAATATEAAGAGTGPSPPPPAAALTRTLWDRKVDGGFPETKEIKRRLRDVIEPGRNLGHVDRDYPPRPPPASAPVQDATGGGGTTGVHQELVGHPAGLITPSRPRPSPKATASPAAERLDPAHHAAVSAVTDEVRSEPKCEDCQ